MTDQFRPTEVFVHGPDLPRMIGRAEGYDIVMGPGPAKVVILRGRVPIRKKVYFLERNDSELKIAGRRILRVATFEFCGSLIDPMVDVAATASTPEEALSAVGHAVRYALDHFTIR
jgi:hypothetical protein